MAHIYRHKLKGWQVLYEVWFPEGDSARKSRYSNKRLKADQIYREVSTLEDISRRGALNRKEVLFFLNRKYVTREEAERLAGGAVAVTRPWAELRKAYEDYSRRNCEGYTHACNMVKLDILMDWFEKHDPASVTKETVEAYIDKRSKDVVEKGKPDENGKRRTEAIKYGTIEKELNILKKLMDPLGPPGARRNKRGIWPENPARLAEFKKKKDGRVPRPLWREDLKALYKALRGHRKALYGYLVDLVMTQLYAGLRPKELINLTPADVNLSIGKIIVQGKPDVRTKTGKERSVEIHPKLEVFLRSALRKGGRYVFGGETKLGPKSVSRAIRKVIEDAGLDGVTPYGLRHTFITALLRSGADIREVQDRAGHSRLETTMRYLHVAPTKNPVKRIRFKD